MSITANVKLGQVVWRLNVEDAQALGVFLRDHLPPDDMAHREVTDLLDVVADLMSDGSTPDPS